MTTKKNNLFDELKTGPEEIQAFSQGKITLKTTQLTPIKTKDISPKQILSIRNKYQMSRAVFAHYLHTSTRTLEKWEQGVSKPNQQAITLLFLTDKYPDTIKRLSVLQ